MNPLPPLGLAPELRAQVLQADTAVARLRAVGRGLDTSLEHLRVLSKSPIRRWGYVVMSQKQMLGLLGEGLLE